MSSDCHKNHYCRKKNRKALALLCLTSGLRPNAANSSDLYFDSIRCYASYAPGTRVTDAINTSVFPGKMCSDRRKNTVVDRKRKQKALALLCLA